MLTKRFVYDLVIDSMVFEQSVSPDTPEHRLTAGDGDVLVHQQTSSEQMVATAEMICTDVSFIQLQSPLSQQEIHTCPACSCSYMIQEGPDGGISNISGVVASAIVLPVAVPCAEVYLTQDDITATTITGSIALSQYQTLETATVTFDDDSCDSCSGDVRQEENQEEDNHDQEEEQEDASSCDHKSPSLRVWEKIQKSKVAETVKTTAQSVSGEVKNVAQEVHHHARDILDKAKRHKFKRLIALRDAAKDTKIFR